MLQVTVSETQLREGVMSFLVIFCSKRHHPHHSSGESVTLLERKLSVRPCFFLSYEAQIYALVKQIKREKYLFQLKL